LENPEELRKELYGENAERAGTYFNLSDIQMLIRE
jgi:hypothetical protein